MDKWISVKVRLPEKDKKVLTASLSAINDYSFPYTYEDSIELGFLSGKGIWYRENWCEDLLEGGRKKGAPEDYELEFVSHWCELPARPE